MTVQWQTRSIDMGQGLDTKTDPKHVIPGKFTRLENAVRNKAGKIEKRNGYDALSLNIIGGGTIQNPKMVKSFGDRLVCAGTSSVSGQKRLFDYSESLSAWRDAGQYESIAVTNTFISGSNVNERAPSCAVAGNYALVAYDAYQNIEDTTAASPLYVGVSVIDLQTNTTLLADFQIKSGGGLTYGSKAVLLGASTLGVLYYSSNGICLRIASITSGGVSLGAELPLVTDVINFGGLSQYPWISFDFVNTSSGGTLAYASSTGTDSIQFKNLSTAGAITGTGSIAASGYAFPLSLNQDASGNIWTYWADAPGQTLATGTSVYYAIVSSSLSSVLAKTQIGSGYSYVRQICASILSSTTQNVYFSQSTYQNFDAASAGILGRPYPQINIAVVTLAGSANPPAPTFMTNVDIYSKPFTVGGITHLACVYYSPSQATGFLVQVSSTATPSIVAKFLPGSAEGAYSTELVSISVGGYWWRQPGSLSVCHSYGSKILMASGKILEDDITGGTGSANYNHFIAGTVLVGFDWSHVDAFQSVSVNGALVLNGGVVSSYDGSSVTELGFHVFPELGASITLSGGFIVDGTYAYQAIYQWVDSAGNVHKSAASDIVNVTISGGAGAATVTLKIKAPLISQKDKSGFPSKIYIYRSLVNSQIPYLLSVVDVDPTVPGLFYTWVDKSSTVNQAQPIYTNGGAVLDNDAPPAAMALWVNESRLWLQSSEQDITYYSKTVAQGTGVSMSNLLTVETDDRLGKTVAGIGLDEKTILIKERGFMYFFGDGADDSGNGSRITSPQVIPSDTGGVSSRSVCLIPDGVLAKTPKGLYLVNRGMSVSYYGADVEDFNPQDVQDVRIIGNANQVRILTSSGNALVYDAFFRQWYVFTNHQGYSSDVWGGSYVYVRTDGNIYIENASGTYLDNGTAYQWRGQTGWLKFSSVQGFQRVRRVITLGDFLGASGHGIQISSAYDFVSTFVSHIPFSFAGSNGAFQYQERFPRQKCNAVQLLIEEVTTGASGEYMSLSDMDLEFGIKRGLNKLSASQKVG